MFSAEPIVTTSQQCVEKNGTTNGKTSSTEEFVKRVATEIEPVEAIPDCKIIRPKLFPDERGFFCESYNADELKTKFGFNETFYQDNHSYSKFGVVRGLHAQKGMGKLVSVISGRIYDVAVDIRPGSKTFGQWHAVYLDGKSREMFWIPDGFLHGFQCVSEEGAHVVYKCSATYDPKEEFGINPFDSDIGIPWPEPEKCIVSERDQKHPAFSTLIKRD